LAEEVQHGVALLLRQLVGHDDADAQPEPFHIIHPLRGPPEVNPRLAGQLLRVAGRHREQAELLLAQQIVLVHRLALLLAQVRVVAGQLDQREGAQLVLVRLEGDQVVSGEVLEAVGHRAGQGGLPFAEEDHVEPLLPEREVPLHLHRHRLAAEEVHP
jgi:hypothetical protein